MVLGHLDNRQVNYPPYTAATVSQNRLYPVGHWKENLPTDLDGNSFQSNSLSILALFLEIETFLLINKPKHLFVITWISNQIYL